MKSGKVAEHPPGKVGLSLRLVLDMDQKQRVPIAKPGLDQQIDFVPFT